MKSKWEKFKEFYKSKYGKPIIFFGFYFFFFLFVFMLGSQGNSTSKAVSNTQVSMWDTISNNYEYYYEITSSNNQVTTLEGKRFNNKNLFTKTINGKVDSDVYTFYDTTYLKTNDKWLESPSYVLVNETFNNQYLNIDYLKKVVADAELVSSTTNFDDSKTDVYTFDGLTLTVLSMSNTLKKIDIVDPLYKVSLQYKNINEVKDFVVEK